MSPAGGTSPAGGGRTGVLLGLGAYVLWGVFPLYFPLLAPAGSLEVLAHRVLWSLVLCALALTATSAGLLRRRGAGGPAPASTWAGVAALARSPRRLALLVLAAGTIAVNWGVYIAATTSGHVLEASLGYFINPLVTVALAVVVLRERLRRLQWVAVAVGALAVVVLSVAAGRPPWISLVLAASFGTYGLAKKKLGAASGAALPNAVPALTGLTAETLVLALPALAVVVVLAATGRGTFTEDAPWHPLLLASTGVVTAVPLLMFAGAARRVSLTTTGLLQYVTPVLQLVIGVAVLGEQMAPSRWAGFALVWVALVVFSLDALRAGRAHRLAARPATGPAATASAPAPDPQVSPALR